MTTPFNSAAAAQIARYQAAGYSFFHFDSRDKKAIGKMPWKHYQTNKPTDAQVAEWLKSPIQNYAIVCGEISNLICIDVDTKNGGDPTPFQNLGMHEIRTPSGGYHFYVQYNPALRSTKQSKRKPQGILTAVDIQSDRTIVFAAPSLFTQGVSSLSASGGYEIINDFPVGPIPDALLVQILKEMEPELDIPREFTPYKGHQDPLSARPGDIFNAMATWDQILIPAGWRSIGTSNGVDYWKRPGKEGYALSASTNYKGYGLFFCYTSSTQLQCNKGYTKFSLYAALYHNNDFKAAAKALVMGDTN